MECDGDSQLSLQKELTRTVDDRRRVLHLDTHLGETDTRRGWDRDERRERPSSTWPSFEGNLEPASLLGIVLEYEVRGPVSPTWD